MSSEKLWFFICVCVVYSSFFGLLSAIWVAFGNHAFFEDSGMKTATNIRKVWKKAHLPKGWDAKLPVPVKRDSGAARLLEPILPRGEWAFRFGVFK